jgi:hypothetical protein
MLGMSYLPKLAGALFVPVFFADFLIAFFANLADVRDPSSTKRSNSATASANSRVFRLRPRR